MLVHYLIDANLFRVTNYEIMSVLALADGGAEFVESIN